MAAKRPRAVASSASAMPGATTASEVFLEAAIERANAFAEAGADILFVEAVTSADEVRALRVEAIRKLLVARKMPVFSPMIAKPDLA